MKDLEDWAAVQKVYEQTNSKRETARILGISRNTVRRLLKMKQAPTYSRTVYATKIDRFKEQIMEWLCEPYEFNGTRIYRELKKRGYEGSISPVYNFIHKANEDLVGGHISSKATVRHESPPGDQAQFDWSEYQVPVGGRIHTVYCFSMILAASRKKAVCFSYREDAESIYEAIQELFEDLGGVTLELLIDNPKALVIENNPKSEEEIRYNPQALLLAKHMGTELNACPCYWPRKKGKVERPFHYIEEQLIKGNSFAAMEELNRRGKSFVDEWCNEKHSTTKRIPNQHYLLEEKQELQPLPKERFRIGQLQTRVVSPDSFVSIQTNKYSVPVEYVGKTVQFRMVYGFRIEIYDHKENLILKLEASGNKYDVLSNPEHYKAIAKKVSTSIPQIRRDFTGRFKNGLDYLEAAGRKYNQPTHYARKILELQELYDDGVLDYFIGLAVERDELDISSFRKMLKAYNSGKLKIESESGHGPDEKEAAPLADDSALTRDCSYYEDAMKEAIV